MGSVLKTKSLIRREWDGIEVRDADTNNRLSIKPCDFIGAKKKDPGLCVAKNAAARQYGGRVWFGRTLCYIQITDEKGVVHIERYENSEQLTKFIDSFDLGQEIPKECSFVLKAPTKARKLDVQLKNYRNRRNQIRLGIILPRKGSQKQRHVNQDLRCGTGQVRSCRKS